VSVRAAALPAAALVIVVGWAARPATAQETPTFTLTGQIVDALNERPVIAAVVKVPELRRFVFSDVNGRFHFPDFPEGTWEIVVEQLGYHTLDGSVAVAQGNGLSLRLNPDPVALEGLRVRTRSERLLERRRRLTPYRVTRISPEVIANAINPDPTAIFRRKANSLIVPCSADSDEQMTPGCVVVRGRQKAITVMLDDLPLPGGMVVLQMYPHDHIHSMDWVARAGVLQVYTRDFIRRLDENGMNLSPLVW